MNEKIKHYPWGTIYGSLLALFGGLAWFSQNSINAYWSQTYHEESLLQRLDKYPAWKAGGNFNEALLNQYQNLQTWWAEKNAQWANWINPQTSMEIAVLTEELLAPKEVVYVSYAVQNWLKTVTLPRFEPESQAVEKNAEIAKPQTQEVEVMVQLEQQPAKNVKLNPVVKLKANDVVFFAGDSLMQGVAPHLQKWLSGYKVKSVNLSKQSTGLSYPSFFDWPKTIETELRKNKQIKLLVVFLGANDPWDFPDPSKRGGKYLKFESPEWETVYRSHIQRIMAAAKKANAKVIWVGVPHMKGNKLNRQVQYLNQLYESEMANHHATFLPMVGRLSDGKPDYQEAIMVDGKLTKVRSKDGIHFTLAGQKVIAQDIQNLIAMDSK